MKKPKLNTPHRVSAARAAKARVRRAKLVRARNIVHNNVPKVIRHAFLPMTAQAAKQSVGMFVPFSDRGRNRLIKYQKGEKKQGFMEGLGKKIMTFTGMNPSVSGKKPHRARTFA